MLVRDGTRCRPGARVSLKALYAVSHGGRGGSLWRRYDRMFYRLSEPVAGRGRRVARADTSALADAYRAALGAKAATEKAQTALDAIDAFEASGKNHGGCGATHDVVHHARASKAFPQGAGPSCSSAGGRRCVYQYRACLRWPGARCAGGLARSVEAEYRALKAAQSALDINDLLRMAYEAPARLPGHPCCVRGGRFKMVMIDEFQDTDQMQVDLIRYLTGAGSAHCAPWAMRSSPSIASVAPRSRCSVVRSAKVGSSAAPEATAVADAPAGELVKLVRNFRSHDEVLRYVARVFDGDDGGLMQGLFGS